MRKVKKCAILLMMSIVLALSGLQVETKASANSIKVTSDVNKAWTILFTKEVDESKLAQDAIYVKNEAGNKVELKPLSVQGKKIIVSPKNSYSAGTYTMHISSNIAAKNDKVLVEARTFTFKVEPIQSGDVVFTEKGTFGNTTYNGNVEITKADTTFENAVVKGNLTIAASVGEGEVYLNNVKVEGETKILGGGSNSVYLKDVTLATVIVNKETGIVRVVVEGNTVVDDVSVESQAILKEQNLTGTGFDTVLIKERVGNTEGKIVLEGTFSQVQNLAANVNLQLADDTVISELVLSALTVIAGDATIQNLQVAVNGGGSTIEARPENVILDGGVSIEVAGNQINESYTNIEATTIKQIKANPVFTQVVLANKMLGLTLADFEVTAYSVSNGAPVTLTNLAYNDVTSMLTYKLSTPYLDEYITIEVKAAATSTKLSGSAKVSFTNSNGVYGRVTDIYGLGVANAAILPVDSYGDYYYSTTATNEYGYYFSPTPTNENIKISVTAPGYAEGFIYANIPNDTSIVEQNLTLIRAAASDEWKIRVTWNGEESDIDSHLASDYFHVYFDHREHYGPEGYEYVDLDWDDTDYYGPETTTIREFQDGRYIFFLHNYSGRHNIEVSESKVELFKGNKTVADFVYHVPQTTNGEHYWGVFELLVSNNGQTIEVVEVDQMAVTEDILKAPKEALTELVETMDLTAPTKEGFEVAYNKAKAAVASTATLTTKEYIQLYNDLYSKMIHPIVFSNYNNTITLTTYDGDHYRNIPSKFKIRLNVNEFEPSEEYGESEYAFTSGDLLKVSLSLAKYSEQVAVQDDQIKVKNLMTGTEYVLNTHEYNELTTNLKFEDLLAMDGTEYEIELPGKGEYYGDIYLETTNRFIEDYYGKFPITNGFGVYFEVVE